MMQKAVSFLITVWIGGQDDRPPLVTRKDTDVISYYGLTSFPKTVPSFLISIPYFPQFMFLSSWIAF